MTVKKVSDLSPDEGLTLRDAGHRFINSYRSSGKRAAYLVSLEETIGYLDDYSRKQGWPSVPHITTEHLEDYFAYSRTRPKFYGERPAYEGQALSSSYLNRQYRQLHSFWEWLVKREFAARNVVAVMNPPKVEERVVPTVSDEQITDLLSLVNPKLARTLLEVFRQTRNNALLHIFIDTPGRRNEVATMKVGDLFLGGGKIQVMGKGGRQRFMPIGRAAQRALEEYLEARETLAPVSPNLWISETGKAMEPDWILQLFKRLKKRANMPRLHPHIFRHTFAIGALRERMPEQILMIIGGWRKIPPTYFRTLGFEDAAEFHRRMSPGDRLSSKSPPRKWKGTGKGKGKNRKPKGRL